MTANLYAVSTINLSDGRVVTLSYGVAVAVYLPIEVAHAFILRTGFSGELKYGHIKTDRKYSVTSSRHANLYARQNGSETRTVPHEVFRQLVAPVATEE